MATKRKRSAKKKNNDKKTYYASFSLILIILLIITVFQLGIVGEYTDAGFNFLFGTSRYFTYFVLLLAAFYLATHLKFPFTKRMFGYILLQFGLLFLLHSILYLSNQSKTENYYTFKEIVDLSRSQGFEFTGGGIIGQTLFNLSSTSISFFGTLLIGLIFVYLSIIIIRHKSIEESLRNDFTFVIKGLTAIGAGLVSLVNLIVEKIKNRPVKEKKEKVKPDKDEDSLIETHEVLERKNKKKSQVKAPVEKEEVDPLFEEEYQEPEIYDSEEIVSSNEEVPHEDHDLEIETDVDEQKEIEYEDDNADMPHDVTTDGKAEDEFDEFDSEELKELTAYKLPPIELLNDVENTEKVSNKEVIKQGRILEETLKNFGVNAKVSKIRIGPAVTQFEVQPDIGVKVSKIINLQNDIALSLAAKDIRIEAPIPGKSAVGIEVPNSVISMVTLREVIKRKSTKNPLEVALGKDISGAPIMAELNKMPHLLVAGSTGSGKSVCINGIIVSILLNAKPHEVKLMMIDPKMVELNVYNGIPHLLAPVVTNPQKASDALNRIVSEMERRYDLFSHSSTRNIEAYNQYLERNAENPKKVQKLPYIVVIVDELADLMMVASKDVEASITRIAQMARAAGIHLIIATQRPSVDVITGIIKANIPSRIAFAVSSQTDSRTIIDSMGAEKLLGRGDMLFLPSGRSKPIRVQGAFLDDDEVTDIVKYITEQMKANYEKSVIMNQKQEEKAAVESEDELYPDAKWFVIEEQRASASLLQRQFRVGYNRAARLVDDLEANGVIGPASGSKPRSVLIENHED
ncbi:FtsK/SpoIIIE family DNA translocase [Jeotgalicoccus meleagridis]|uniref:DNA translocase FtsK n=1 Tax=Jeotgalicoccus meleagridis TaxID=2759181 RepID=A0A6V7RMZ4_9STAP|nr:DNA translocase FtsK [Jeotgalicoccus meleagridis]CAD2079056.1 DNA translocase FtsK [Jeotgalicoccus meleagridis]